MGQLTLARAGLAKECSMRMIAVPPCLASTIVDLNGEAGVDWLNQLPGLLGECEVRWSLTLLPPFQNLTYNYVAPAVRPDGTAVVLKLGFVCPELMAEIDALELFGGHSAVRLLDADRSKGALLLERLQPGSPLSALEDDERATSIAAGVMRAMWRPVPPVHIFPSIEDWALGLARLRAQFGGGTGPLPARLVDIAEKLFGELAHSMTEPVLLHGDLHHDNILAAEREPWLAIDPKGLIGEPAYEVGALLRNPMPQLLSRPNVVRVLMRRADQLSEELGLDRERVIGWGLAQAVLAAAWSLEDQGHGWEPWISCAEILALIRK